MCAISPVIMVSAMVGITVASLSGSVAAGWLAAAGAAVVMYLVGRRRSWGNCRTSVSRPPTAARGETTRWGIVGKAEGVVRRR